MSPRTPSSSDCDGSPAPSEAKPDAESPAQPGDLPTATPEPALRPGAEIVHGKVYLRDARGSLVPEELIKPQHLLEDEVVRELLAEADALAEQISSFKRRCFERIGIFSALLADQYGSRVGGAKGNKTLASFDGLLRVQVQIADITDFGPELQVAKSLFDECLEEWSADTKAELRAIVTDAFQVNKEGQINRGRLFGLLRTESKDERWIRAQAAIRDSIRVSGSTEYVRFHRRPTHNANWSHVSLDIATA